MNAPTYDRIPVTVLTGFLGSGKTTLLQGLLEGDSGARVAVLINELGEVGLDHLLVKNVTETAVVLQNGCVCCTIRSDLQKGLRDLIDGRSRGDVPPFDRVLLETTGLADPVPIAQTLTADAMLRRQVRLANIITTVDALFGMEQLDTHGESRRQAAIADRLVLTKTDLAEPEQVRSLRRKLESVNPMAMMLDAFRDRPLWPVLLDMDPFDPQTKTEEVRAWLARLPAAEEEGHHHHDDSIRTFAVRTERRLDWTAFAVWLSALVHRHGSKILRIKGLLDVPGARGPVVLHTVQRYITPPMHLDAWPDDDHSSRLVFIVQGLPVKKIRDSLDRFLDVLEEV